MKRTNEEKDTMITLAETRRCKPCRQRRKLTIMPSREVQSAT